MVCIEKLQRVKEIPHETPGLSFYRGLSLAGFSAFFPAGGETDIESAERAGRAVPQWPELNTVSPIFCCWVGSDLEL
jgi:hypothetical protein